MYVSKYFISIKFNNETAYKQTKIYQLMQINLSYIEMDQWAYIINESCLFHNYSPIRIFLNVYG